MGEDGGCTGMEARTEDRLAGSMNEQTVGSLGGGEDEWMCLDANMQTCTEKCEKMIIAINASCFSHTVRGKFTYRRNAVEAVAPVASCCQDSWHFVKQCKPLLL